MKVYNYNSEGYLIGISELDESDKCQITGNWLIPAQATDKEPLESKEGFEIKFLENEWQYIKLLSIEEKKVRNLVPLEDGQLIKDGQLIILEKPNEFYSWSNELTEWIYDENKKQVKINKINQNAYDEIILLYPLWRQSNIQTDSILTGNNVELEKMNLFISQIRTKSDKEIELIKSIS